MAARGLCGGGGRVEHHHPCHHRHTQSPLHTHNPRHTHTHNPPNHHVRLLVWLALKLEELGAITRSLMQALPHQHPLPRQLIHHCTWGRLVASKKPYTEYLPPPIVHARTVVVVHHRLHVLLAHVVPLALALQGVVKHLWRRVEPRALRPTLGYAAGLPICG